MEDSQEILDTIIALFYAREKKIASRAKACLITLFLLIFLSIGLVVLLLLGGCDCYAY